MTKDELTALEVLQNDKNIVIKQADKGGAFVVMDKQYYIDKINDLLKDSGTYKTLPENGDEKVMAKLKKFVNQHRSILTKKKKLIILQSFSLKPAILKPEKVRNETFIVKKVVTVLTILPL